MSDKPKSGIPEAVARIIAQAQMQRGDYQQNPDPLTVAEPEPEDESVALSAEEILEHCSREPETDIGNARRFIERYGDQVLHVTNVGWHGYTDGRWLEDASGAVVRRLAHLTAEFIDDEAVMLDCNDDERAKIEAGKLAIEELKELGKPDKKWTAEEIEKHDALQAAVDAMLVVNKDRAGRMSSRHGHAKSSAGTSKINNMLTEAIPYVSREVNDLNCDLHAINCRNGTLRFYCAEVDGSRKWAIRLDRHRASDFISKLAQVDFDAKAAAPLFAKFLQKVMPNVDIRHFLQRYMGYCLLGLTVEQCLLFFYGAGRNGKSTFVDLMVEILGDYAVSMSIDSFAGDSKRAGAEATPDLARLPGARLVAASEPEMGVRLKDALIKALTGGEVIAVRRLHQDFFELVPQFKIILSGNHKPIIHDDSDGIWRRVHLVPFEIQIAEEEVDRDLPRKLRVEKAGIFAWMVRGALEYLEHGLQVPAGVSAATAEYREESDPIGAFLRNACHITGKDEDRCTPEDLFIAYTNYAKREGLSEFKQQTFTRRLPDQTHKSWRGPDDLMHQFRRARSNGTLYLGIRIRDEFRRPSSHPDSQPSYRYSDDEPLPETYP